MGAHLLVIMFHHVREYFQDVDLRGQLLTLILTPIPQRKIHEKSCSILHRIVTEVVLAALEDLHDPGDDSPFDHVGLRALPQAELLERAECILSKIRIIAALSVESLNQHGHDVVKLEQIATALVLIC